MNNIRNLFPGFYNEEYPGLIEFVESYYEFLNNSQFNNSISKIRDIDSTLTLFSDQLKKELLYLFPAESVINTTELLRNAKHFYSVKGTESSYKFLFRALFGSDVSLSYPSNSILRLSDGTWEQNTDLHVRFTSGNPTDIIGRNIRINNTVDVLIERIKKINNTDYILYVDGKITTDFNIGDTVVHNDVVGFLLPVLSSVSIISPGNRFRVGQLYDVIGGWGNGAKVRILKVGSLGEVQKIEIIDFGFGYTGRFTQSIRNSSAHVPYAIDYFTEEYTNDNLNLILDYSAGPVARQTGFFSSSKGFLSSDMKLQDNEYYQTHSYVLKVDHTIDKYIDVVKKLLHPVGWTLFGELQITNKFNLDLRLTGVSQKIIRILRDVIGTTDVVDTKFNKLPEDNVVTIHQQSNDYIADRSSFVQPTSAGYIFLTTGNNIHYAEPSYVEDGFSTYSLEDMFPWVYSHDYSIEEYALDDINVHSFADQYFSEDYDTFGQFIWTDEVRQFNEGGTGSIAIGDNHPLVYSTDYFNENYVISNDGTTFDTHPLVYAKEYFADNFVITV